MALAGTAAAEPARDGVAPTPLPARVMLVLCVVIFSEPMSLTILCEWMIYLHTIYISLNHRLILNPHLYFTVPFIYFMVRDFGIAKDEKDIGFYVGFIASSFSLAQFLTSIFWGWMSDKVGRRPVLLLGLLGNTITIIMFGQSHSLTWAIISRSLCGFLNGNIGVAKSLLGEITDTSNEARAYSLFGFVPLRRHNIRPYITAKLSSSFLPFPHDAGSCSL
jgi:MFS family permease